jgi:hypothetical protein
VAKFGQKIGDDICRIALEALVGEKGKCCLLYTVAPSSREGGHYGIPILEEAVYRADGHAGSPGDGVHGRGLDAVFVEQRSGRFQDGIEGNLTAPLLGYSTQDGPPRRGHAGFFRLSQLWL